MDRRSQLTAPGAAASAEGAAPVVWITRALPGALATADRLAALGFTPVVEPLIETRPLAATAPDLSPYAALAFTSATGVRAFAALYAGRALPVFAVGDATAAAARQAGFRQVRSAGGDLTALDALLAEAAPGRVLAPGALRPSGELHGAERLALYATRPAPGPWPLTWAAADAGRLAAVLLHAPSAAHSLAALARPPAAPDQGQGGPSEAPEAWAAALSASRILALSPACAAPVAAALPAAAVSIAAAPNEAALLRLLTP